MSVSQTTKFAGRPAWRVFLILLCAAQVAVAYPCRICTHSGVWESNWTSSGGVMTKCVIRGIAKCNGSYDHLQCSMNGGEYTAQEWHWAIGATGSPYITDYFPVWLSPDCRNDDGTGCTSTTTPAQ